LYLFLTNQTSQGLYDLQNNYAFKIRSVAKDIDYIDDVKQEVEALCTSM